MRMKGNDPHAPLRDNVRMLGEMLGDAIREQHGEALFSRIEGIRRQAVTTRGGGFSPAELAVALGDLTDAELVVVARAFNQFLNLANIAEQHHRVRCRHRADVAPGAEGTLEALATRLSAAGLAEGQLKDALHGLSVELVLTAHPTEVTRRTLMHKYNAIADALALLDRTSLNAGERAAARDALRRQVKSAWRTDEIRRERPTPVDEAKWGFATIEQTLWHALPRFLRDLDGWMRIHAGGGLPLDAAPVRFAAWMGGDRDGNPNVTHAVTREVVRLARWQAADLFLRDVEALIDDLSMQEAGAALRAQVGDTAEPYRVLLKALRKKLRNTLLVIEAQLAGAAVPALPVVESDEDLRAPLQLAHDSLCECGMADIAAGPLTDTLRRVAAFGACLLRLDIRQESTRHARALAAVTRWLALGDYLAWDEPARQAFLSAELRSRRPLFDAGFLASPHCDDEVRETLATFAEIAALPRSAFASYVISMAGAPSDVLAVLLLQKASGIGVPLPVVPLFETLDDLDNAPRCIDALLAMPEYRTAVGDYQQVMIGYSDSAKDAGYLAASWAQYRAQEALTAVCTRHGVQLELFHGRGGSVSRGGTPTRQALLSQPPGSVQGRIRVTEQGEVIRFKFGLEGVALENLELYVASTLEATLLPPPVPEPDWRALMDTLTDVAVRGYRDTVRGEPHFVDYLRTVTPEQELAMLAIGSRPARRRAQGGLETLRAIPWVFAWTQIRLMLPAWLGTDRALAWLLAHPEQRATLEAMLARWPYFQAVVDMLEMVLAKSDARIAYLYEERLGTPALAPLGAQLRARLAGTVRDLLALTGRDALLGNNPVLQWSIAVRDPYTDPLHLLQAELIQRHRKGGSHPDAQLESALKVTIAGIAAGLRNTG
jgi:phosphoenolpyruvate carboxylase